MIYQEFGLLDCVCFFFEELFFMWCEIYGEKYDCIVLNFNEFVWLYYSKGDFDQLEVYFFEMFDVFEQMDCLCFYVVMFNNLGMFYVYVGKQDDVKVIFEEVLW